MRHTVEFVGFQAHVLMEQVMPQMSTVKEYVRFPARGLALCKQNGLKSRGLWLTPPEVLPEKERGIPHKGNE